MPKGEEETEKSEPKECLPNEKENQVKGAGSDKENEIPNETKQEEAASSNEKQEEERVIDGSELNEFNLAFNADAFTDYNRPEDDEVNAQVASDEKNVREVSKFLRETIIPTLVTLRIQTFMAYSVD